MEKKIRLILVWIVHFCSQKRTGKIFIKLSFKYNSYAAIFFAISIFVSHLSLKNKFDMFCSTFMIGHDSIVSNQFNVSASDIIAVNDSYSSGINSIIQIGINSVILSVQLQIRRFCQY